MARILKRVSRLHAALLVFAVLGTALLAAAPAAAQTAITLVSNTGQSFDRNIGNGRYYAQAFTTGNNSGGYTLSSVDIISGDAQGDDATVSVCTVDGGGYPTSTCTALTVPGSFTAGTLTFTASPGMTLAKNTTYTVLIGSPGGEILALSTTTSDGEDTGGATGWSIADDHRLTSSSDIWGTTTSGRSFQITIKGTATSSTNTAPTVATVIPEQSATAGTEFSYAFPDTTFTDAEGDTLTYMATQADGTALPTWLSFADATRIFSGTPAAADVATVAVEVTASDGNGGSVSDEFNIVVSAATNTAPTVATVIPEQSATAGTEFSYAFPDTTFTDAEGDTLTYMATQADGTALPTWLSFADATRIFSGTPAAADVATVAVEVTASDGNGGSVSDEFNIVVSAADTTPPTLTRAVVSGTGSTIRFSFSEDPQSSNLPPAAVFTVTVDNSPHATTGNLSHGLEEIVLLVSPAIGARQSVVVTYTDPTGGDDTAAIQDAAGNDVATFTTDLGGVPAVTNNSIVNIPATGAPTITGTPQVGQTLTAVTTAIMDGNGLNNVSYTYQWIRVATDNTETNISIATAGSYTLVTDDLGKTIKVKVSFTDDAGNAETLTSVATAAVAAAPNIPPSASNGTVTTNEDTAHTFTASEFSFSDTDGDTLSNVRIVTLPASGKGTLALSGTSVTANQVVAATAIGALAYTPTANANGAGYASFTFKVSDGTDESAAYTMTINVTAVNDAPTVANTITDQAATVGTAFNYAFPATTFSDTDGDTLTYMATKGDGATLPTWLSFTDGARTFSGMPQTADAGMVSVKVTASDGGGGSVSDEFDITVNAASNTPATGATAITGAAQVGRTLTAVTTAIRDANGLNNVSYTYQWIRVDGGAETDILGATASAYTLVTADRGKTIKVKVRFRDDAINSETLTSAATAVVAAAPNTPATGATAITGAAQVGRTLTAVTTAIRDANGLNNVSYTYQWIRVNGSDSDIGGATARTYTPVADDLGKTIKVKVNFTDDAGYSEMLTSAATAAVSAAAPGGGSTATPPVNNAPSFLDTRLTLSIAENTAADADVGEPVRATNPAGDALIYTLERTDAASFTVDASTGQIRTKTGVDYDHETKAVYSVTVKADDGGGGVAATPVTINVTDVAEKPAAPAAPLVEATANGLEVSWTKPDSNGGPEVTGYEVQYREGTSGAWTDWAHRGAGASTRLTRLKADTVYEVRVRALNGEMPSDWSEPVRGSTGERLDHLARAWLGRFSREVAKHVTDAIGERMRGVSGSGVVLGGQRMMTGGEQESEAVNSRLGEALSRSAEERFLRGRDAPHPRALEVSLPELLLGSSFHLASAENPATEARWSVWGQGAKSGFEAAKDTLSLDGEVVTAMLGLDFEWERWLFGMVFSRSMGEGSFQLGGTCGSGCAGEVDDTMTGVHPYVRYEGAGGLSAWGVLGHGRGEMTLTRGESEVEVDTGMRMAAFGGRGVVLAPSYRGGFELALRSDVLLVSASSEAVGGVMDADVDMSRFRLLLEGSREYRFGAEGVMRPSLEVGLRYDGGDLEKGSGLEVGGGLRYAAPSIGLTVEMTLRGLLTHEEKNYQEWGMSASMRIDPGDEGRGLSVKFGSQWGAAGGGAEQLLAQRSMAGLAREADPPGASLGAEVAYGLDAPRGLLTPYTGVSLAGNGKTLPHRSSFTWRAGARWKLGPAFEVNLEASLREPEGDEKPESGILLRGSIRW